MSQVKPKLQKAVDKEGRKGTERAYARCRKLRQRLMAKMKNSSPDSSAL